MIEIDQYVTEATIHSVHHVLDNAVLASDMAERNYQLALRYFSYTELRRQLKLLLTTCFG